LFLVTRKGKVIRIAPFSINPQGVAGNGIAGMKLAEDDDAIIAAFTGTDATSLLSISEKSYKVTTCSDIPRKGRGGQGVGFHLFVKGEDGVVGKIVKPANRVKSTTKGVADWARAETS
jgi:DNA gyrase subunit A